MEGKAVLFKKFAQVDCFDIEIDEADPEKLAEIICALEPSFGGRSISRTARAPDGVSSSNGSAGKRMNIPVFHDDQHGHRHCGEAPPRPNALKVAGKRIEDVKVVSTGGGAAGILPASTMAAEAGGCGGRTSGSADRFIHGPRGTMAARSDMYGRRKAEYAQGSEPAAPGEVIEGAGPVFLGLSGPNVLMPDMVGPEWRREAESIFALGEPRARDPAGSGPRGGA